MIQDSIRVIDTITVKDTVVMHDTIVKIVNHSEGIEFYKELLSSQNAIYSLMIYMFIGVLAVFVGATWLYNTKIARTEIKKETRTIFEDEKAIMIKEFKKDFGTEISFTKGESARLFANSANSDEPYDLANKYYWWLAAIKHYIKADIPKGIRMSTEMAIEAVQQALKVNKQGVKEYIEKTYPDTNFLTIIKNIPDILDEEKKELTKLTEELLGKEKTE